MKRRLWPVLLASCLGLAILVTLGVWQVQRLAWKEAMIARIDQALAAPPQDLATATAHSTAPGGDLDFVKVQLTGRFTGKPLRRITVLNGGPGWDVIQAFTSSDGASLLVLRGTAGENQDLPAASSDALHITGILRRHGAGRGLFEPDNDVAANRWYWWDLTAMHLASEGTALRHADLVLHLLPGSPGTEGLVVDPPKANLRNNHLGYAITWFGLAIVLVVMTGVFVFQRTPKPGA